MNLKLRNPIPKQVNDPKKLTQFFKKMGLVPYAGTNEKSSHNFLSYLCDLSELSPTHGACINDIRYYAFDGDLDIGKKSFQGLKIERDELEQPVKEQFAQALENVGITLADIRDITKQLFTALKVTGNAYLYYREVTVGGTKRVFLHVIHPKKTVFLDTDEMEEKVVVIAKDFNEKYFKENGDKVKTYPVFPAMDISRDGGKETVFHIKNMTDDNLVYGRPDSIASLLWQHIEFSLSELTIKVGTTEIVAQKLIAFQRPSPDQHIDDEALKEMAAKRSAQIRKLLTNEGINPQSVSTIDYNHDAQPPTVIDIQVNRDIAYLEKTLNIASSYICAGHRWSGIITGKTNPSAGIGGNATIDQLKLRDEGVVRGHQRFFSNFWCMPFALIAEFSNAISLSENTVLFPNTLTDLTESLNAPSRKGGNGQQFQNPQIEIDEGLNE